MSEYCDCPVYYESMLVKKVKNWLMGKIFTSKRGYFWMPADISLYGLDISEEE